MAQISLATRGARALRLLLDIYGFALILLVAGGPLALGLTPYETLLRLGAPGFYALLIGATLAWAVTVPVLWRRSVS